LCSAPTANSSRCCSRKGSKSMNLAVAASSIFYRITGSEMCTSRPRTPTLCRTTIGAKTTSTETAGYGNGVRPPTLTLPLSLPLPTTTVLQCKMMRHPMTLKINQAIKRPATTKRKAPRRPRLATVSFISFSCQSSIRSTFRCNSATTSLWRRASHETQC